MSKVKLWRDTSNLKVASPGEWDFFMLYLCTVGILKSNMFFNNAGIFNKSRRKWTCI